MLSPDKYTAIKKYLNLVNYCGSDDDNVKDFEEIKSFLKLDDNKTETLKADTKVKWERKSLPEILELLNIDLHTKNLLITGSQKHCITAYKINFIKEALFYKHSIKDIATFLNANESAIYKLLSRHNISL